MALESTCPKIKNMLLLDSEGKRIAVKYYSPEWSTVNAQASFEKLVFAKTNRLQARGEAEVTLFDDVVVVYKHVGDLLFYVTGDQNENELVLLIVLQAFYEAVTLELKGVVEKKTVLENLDLILLTMDEIVDGGLVLETDPGVVANRVYMRSDGSELPSGDQLPAQIFSQALATAKEQIARSLLR